MAVDELQEEMVIPRSKQTPRKAKSAGGFTMLDKFINTASKGGLSIIDLIMVAVASILATYFFLGFFGSYVGFGKNSSSIAYNSSQLYTANHLDDGSVELNMIVVTDLDHDSKHPTVKNTWQSFAKRGTLRIGKGAKTAQVKWDDSADFTLNTQIAAGGRAMELSDLVVFNGRLLSTDDRTGLIFEIKNEKAVPWLLLNDGPGDVNKGLKAEWMTVKDGELYVGGLGKEWTTTAGEYVNDHPMWIKIVSTNGAVRHVAWKDVYINARRAAGIEYPGYMIHEAVQWSAIHKKWFFLPRRASNQKYTEETDEHMGTNKMMIANEELTSFRVVEVGEVGNGQRGFSAFQFVPGTNERIIIALKSEEKDGKPVASYVSVFDIEGNIIMKDSPLHGAYKFEGIVFA